jgi:hypothetical protein
LEINPKHYSLRKLFGACSLSLNYENLLKKLENYKHITFTYIKKSVIFLLSIQKKMILLLYSP